MGTDVHPLPLMSLYAVCPVLVMHLLLLSHFVLCITAVPCMPKDSDECPACCVDEFRSFNSTSPALETTAADRSECVLLCSRNGSAYFDFRSMTNVCRCYADCASTGGYRTEESIYDNDVHFTFDADVASGHVSTCNKMCTSSQESMENTCPDCCYAQDFTMADEGFAVYMAGNDTIDDCISRCREANGTHYVFNRWPDYSVLSPIVTFIQNCTCIPSCSRGLTYKSPLMTGSEMDITSGKVQACFQMSSTAAAPSNGSDADSISNVIGKQAKVAQSSALRTLNGFLFVLLVSVLEIAL